MATRELEKHSRRDALLSEVRRCIRKGVWSNQECIKYFPVKRRTGCHQQSCFKWNSRYYFPKSKTASTSYCTRRTFGIVATKLRLRTKVRWPGIDKDAEQCVRPCHGSQFVGQAIPPEPLMSCR